MYFEILNTVKFFILFLMIAIVFHHCRKYKLVDMPWKVYWIVLTLSALVSYKQFFTFTERVDAISTQNLMEEQSSSVVSSKAIQAYLDRNKPTGPSGKELYEEELKKQADKSKKLAKEIETKHNNGN